MEAAKRAPKGFQWAKQKAVKEADCFAGDDTRLKDLGLKFRDAVVLGLAGWLLGAESSEAQPHLVAQGPCLHEFMADLSDQHSTATRMRTRVGRSK